MKRVKKSTWLPAVLLVWLLALSIIGYDTRAEDWDPVFYVVGIIVTLVIIVLLHYVLKRQERYRKDKEQQ